MAESNPTTSSAIINYNQDSNTITWKHPSHVFQRLLALIFMCVIGFGAYFCFDNPGALQNQFLEDLDLNTSQFVYLYSWYSWPNVVLCFFGGFLIDRVFGIRLGTIIYAVLVVIGQLIFAAGSYLNTLWFMLLGRLIFGIGAESLAVAQNNYAVLWFKGKELNMVFGFQLSFARVGSAVNFLVMEPLYRLVKQNIHVPNYQVLSVVLFIASLTCFISLLCALLLGWQDKRAERLLQRKVDGNRVVKLTDVLYFPTSFWLVSLIIVCYYTSIFPFIALGKVFFEKKYNFSPDAASFISGIIYIISAVFAPLLGFLIDKTGRNLFLVFSGILGTLVSHMCLTFTFVNPYIAMSIMGVSYSLLASALWPLISIIVPEHQLGTAYGIAQSVENLGLAVVALLSGIIVDIEGYYMVELFFCLLLSAALMFTAILWTMDSLNNGILNMSAKKRNELELNKTSQPEKQNLLVNNDANNEDQ